MQPSFSFPTTLRKLEHKRVIKPVVFICQASHAQSVALMGDFNNWDPMAHPMSRQPDGAWRLEVQLSHGHHHYLFSVDGKPTLDPRAQGIARNHLNERVSLIAIS